MDDLEPRDRTQRRDQLILAVENGKMTVREAEKQALAAGIGKLLPSHPVEDFDPMKQERWSLLMALMWVLVRDLEAVRSCWNDFLSTQYHWAKEWKGPRRAVRYPNRWAHQFQEFGLMGEFIFAESPGRSFSVSWEQLRLALRNGAVRAWGRDLREGELADVRPIPAANWDALQASAMPLRRDSPVDSLPSVSPPTAPNRRDTEDMLHFGDGTPVYVSISVERAPLLENFPEPAGERIPGGHAPSIDPVKKITDAMPASETKTAHRRRIAIQAIRTAFPEGVPPTTVAKDRDKLLKAHLQLIDKTIKPYSERSWTRLCDELFRNEQ